MNKLSSIIKLITMSASLIVGAAGGIMAYNHWVVGKYQVEIDVTQQIEEYDMIKANYQVIIDSLALLSREVRGIGPAIEKTNKRIDYLTDANHNLKQYLIDRALDKDEVLDIIHIWDAEKEKNSSD